MAEWYGGLTQEAQNQELEEVLKKLSPEKAAEIRAAMNTSKSVSPGPPAPPVSNSSIITAAQSRNFEPWAAAIFRGALSIDCQDPDGITLMHHAVWEGNRKLVSQLLDAAGCPLDIRAKDGQTPLMVAVARGKLDLMKLLLDRGADIEAVREDKVSAVLIAAQSRQLTALLALKGRGADLQRKDAEGNGCAHWAALVNDVQMLRTLRAIGMSVSEKNSSGQTPLHKASMANAFRAVEYLLSIGCDAFVLDRESQSPIHIARKYRSGAALYALTHRSESFIETNFTMCFAGYLGLLYFTYWAYVMENAAEYLMCHLAMGGFMCAVVVLYFLVKCSRPVTIPPQGDSFESSAIRIVEEKFEEGKFEEIPDSDRFCLTCHLLRPQRSKHCRHCDQCIAKQDLHCSALGHCIGAGNRRLFVLWLLCLCGLISIHLWLEWVSLAAPITESSLPGYWGQLAVNYSQQAVSNIVVIPVNWAVLWYAGCHLYLMLYCVTSAQTANEVLNRHRYRYLFSEFCKRDGTEKLRFKNPFYRSVGRSWLDFLLNDH